MKEFYEITNIDLHFFSTEINDKKFTKVNFSHSTHPNWKLLDVVYCSSCLPILFSPYLDEDKCYIDGGILNNYPLQNCLNVVENHDEIFGIKKTYFDRKKSVDSKSSLFDYLLYVISKIVTVNDGETNITIKNQLEIMADATNLYDVYSATSSVDERTKLIKYGAESWEKYSKATMRP
jgi:predicted acylesterase/phospholipase RssA